MPFFPEFIYRLSQRDQQVTWLDPVLRRISVSTAATTVIAELSDIPIDRCLLLQHAAVSALPGAAQNITRMNLSISEVVGAGAAISLAFSDTDEAALFQKVLTWTGSIIVPPSRKLSATGVYNAGVAANQTILSVVGMLLPIGNIQRV